MKTFRAAPWRSPQELQTFASTAGGQADAALMSKLLEALCDRSLAKASEHDKRCRAFLQIGGQVTDPNLFVLYARALKTAPARARATIAELIPKVNNISAHGELVALMRSPDVQVRKHAADAIRAVGGRTIVQGLGRLVVEQSAPGRSEALDVLVELAGHYAVTPLEAVATNSRLPADGRIHALRHLGNPKYMSKATSRAVAAIGKVIESEDRQVLPAAVNAYCAMCREDDYFDHIAPLLDSEDLNLVKAAVFGLQRFSTQRSMNALDRKFRIGPTVIRMAVLDTLERIGNDQVVPSLVDALKSQELQVRTRAGEVLSSLSKGGKVDLARTVIWLLRSKDVNLRRIAVDLARSVQDTDRLWPKLLAFLRDEDWWVRERVVDALIEMAGRKLAEHIVDYLKDPAAVVRRFGVDVMARLQDPKALQIFAHMAINDEDWWVRERAVEAMASLGQAEAGPRILEAMQANPELRVVGLFALAEVDAKSAAPQIAGMLQEDSYEIQWAALHALEKLGNASLADAVKPFVDHAHGKIRELARNLLARWQVQAPGGVDSRVSALDRFLHMLIERDGDDLVLTSNERPFLKQMGGMVPLSDNKLMGGFVRDLVTPLLSGAQLRALEELEDVDLSYEIPSSGKRFRVNVFHTAKGLSAVFRKVQDRILEFEQLGLPRIVQSFGDYKNGLVLVGGPTGSGKSTTLAALIDYINRSYDRHIISLEDPIEVVHHPQKSLINQREVGTHINSYKNALRAALREDPDVLLVGELRDYDTISFAVTAAETGHLVFGTVHTVSASTTVDRLMNAFPVAQQEQVRAMLAESLRAVLCQHLLRTQDGEGRVLASEVMLNNDAVANMIRKGKAHQIPSAMLTSREQGMILMDDSLWSLYKAGRVSADEVYLKAANKGEFQARFEKEKEDREAARNPGGAPPRPKTGTASA